MDIFPVSVSKTGISNWIFQSFYFKENPDGSLHSYIYFKNKKILLFSIVLASKNFFKIKQNSHKFSNIRNLCAFETNHIFLAWKMDIKVSSFLEGFFLQKFKLETVDRNNENIPYISCSLGWLDPLIQNACGLGLKNWVFW